MKGYNEMRTLPLQSSAKSNRSGSAITALLVIAGLVIVVFLTRTYLKNTAKDPDTCVGLKPWEEWRLRETSEKPAETPFEEQPDISKRLEYNVRVLLQDESRGKLLLVIQPDGSVKGGWSGRYRETDKTDHDIQGSGFNGFVCPLKTYQDENGEDPSKLYFIAKGTFMIHENDSKSKMRISAGDLYLVGWLESDHSINGELTITTNEKYYETFECKAIRPIEL